MRSPPRSGHQNLTDYLADAMRHGHLCPVVGAGASNDLAVPTWNRLIEELGEKLGVQVPPGADPLMAVDILMGTPQGTPGAGQASFREARRSFITQLHEVLYAGTTGWTAQRDFLSYAPALLAALGIFVAVCSPHRTFHIITYNFDCLIEEAVNALGHRAVAVTASNPSPEQGITFEPSRTRSRHLIEPEIRSLVTVRIAHPHGLIRRSGTPHGLDAAMADDLILSRASYQRSSRSPFNLHNLWQIAAYSSMVCLFYGWSFNDSTVQNIIDIGTAIREHGSVRRTDREIHCALVKRPTCSDEYLAREQSYFQEQGILRLLTDDFSDQKTFLIHLLHRLGIRVWQP
jgi:hypothetical protein